jgi:5-methylcytosine-specific restriction enzyme subunit McrC
MGSMVTIREYGCLGNHDRSNGLDYSAIDKHSWLWLRSLCLTRRDKQPELLRLVSRNGQECLQVRNYVGILETPSGSQIEILPKTVLSDKQSIEEARLLLWKMLSRIYEIPWTESEEAHLCISNRPIIEILIYKFLKEVSTIVRRGIRSDYVRTQDEASFLKGSLNVSRQVRRSPSQRHLFDIEYDNYIPDRSENRLIHSALKKALYWSRSSQNQRLARELLFTFDGIPYSTNNLRDFSDWSHGRDMVYYQAAKPWCQLILNEQSPFTLSGNWKGISLLFPMEKLFEKYVSKQLAKYLHSPYRLTEQAKGQSLMKHREQPWFNLRPDIVIKKKQVPIFVLDTKWKLIDANLADSKSKYNISQADMYQLFAYGQKYLDGKGEVFLVYPSHQRFNSPLEGFQYSEELRLWVIPYDLTRDTLLIPETSAMSRIFKFTQLHRVA